METPRTTAEPQKFTIRTPDGAADAWTYRPEGAGAWPAILFYVDAGGVRPAMHRMATRLAALGYLVMLPNALYRAGDLGPVDMKTIFSDPAMRAQIMAAIKQLDAAAATRDAGAYLDAVQEQPGALAGKVGCVGYCLGGRLAFATAGTYPHRVAAAASIHGGHLATGEPDSPHRNADRIQARIYLGVADEDPSCTPEHQALLASSLGAAHVPYQMELYAGAKHGFAVPDAPIYDEAAAERHWARLATLFAEALRRSG
jgi:carboxymethylenebutenolidase